MNQRIDQFCENLRIKLTSIDKRMQQLKARIDNNAQTAEQEVRIHLDAVKKRLKQDRTKVETAQADVKKWIDEFKLASNEKVPSGKSNAKEPSCSSARRSPNATP
jgi:deoxyribodipyrimidine photolyase